MHRLLFTFFLLFGSAQSGTITNQLTPEQKGDVYMARKMYREAIDSYAMEPATSPSRWNKVGIAHHIMLDLKDAKRDYRQAVRLDPAYGEAQNNLGTVYYAEKSYRSAIRQYKKALRLMPESALVYSNLGTGYFARQDFKRASDAYTQALKLDPDVFEHHNSFGILLGEHSVTERAKFHYYLAKAYAKQGMNDRALTLLRKALEEGFTDREKMMQDREFEVLRSTEEFQDLLNLKPRVL